MVEDPTGTEGLEQGRNTQKEGIATIATERLRTPHSGPNGRRNENQGFKGSLRRPAGKSNGWGISSPTVLGQLPP